MNSNKTITTAVLTFVLFSSIVKGVKANEYPWWNFQSIDTMKYSRDLARENATNKSFDAIIDKQVSQIAQTGATHVAIATPYDEEFIPYLTRWVDAARKHDLNVWFRGNLSGWEGWFDYPSITREEHLTNTLKFIKNNSELFENGDVFSPCPECENGGPGDPRQTGDIEEYRKFIIKEYAETSNLFRDLGLNVVTNYASMNADVAKLIMDEKTTKAMGGIIVIDHFVSTPEKVNTDVNYLASKTGGKIVLGEFGVPIPDINGDLSEKEQDEWINNLLSILTTNKNLVGLNYWVSYGGSTQIWRSTGEPKLAVETITKYYSPVVKKLIVINELGEPIKSAEIYYEGFSTKSNESGMASVKILENTAILNLKAATYKDKTVAINYDDSDVEVTLFKEKQTLIFRIRLLILKVKDLIKL